MATINWKTGANGSWNTAADWSGGVVPTINDDVLISAPGTYTVTIGGSDAARSLTLNDATAKINDTGSLTIATTLAITAGTFALSTGGVLNGGTITTASGAAFVAAGGMLNNVVDQGTITMSATSASLAIEHGLSGGSTGVINDTGNSAFLYAYDSQTFDNATLNIGNGAATSYLYVQENQTSAATLTLGSHFNLTQTAKTAQVNIDPQGNGANALVNKGTISAGTATGNFRVYGQYAGDSFTNQGTISVSNGDTFDASNVTSFTNTGVINAVGSKTVLDLGGAWSSSGSISVSSGASANLGGTFSLGALSSLSNSAGTVSITGTLLNTGTTLTLGAGSAAGTVGLSGTILGGTIVDTGGGLSLQGGTLSGVSYHGTLNLLNNNQLFIANGLSVISGSSAGTINVTGNASILRFQGAQTLDNVTLNLGNNGYVFVDDYTGPATLTLGNHLNFMQIGSSVDVRIGPYGTGDCALVNDGVITAGVANGLFELEGPESQDTFSNIGSIIISNGDTFDVSTVATLANAGLISASGDSTILDLGGNWSNTGSIAISNGATANLGGTFTLANFFSLSNSGGQLNITGTLQNAGTTLTLGTGSIAGTVGLGGTILGGTIVDTGGGLLAQDGTLSGVTYKGTLTLLDGNQLHIANGLNVTSGGAIATINDTGNNTVLFFDDAQTFDNATLNLGSAGTSYIYLHRSTSSTALTLGTHINLVHSGADAVVYVDPYGYGTDTLVNKGVITAAVNGGNFQIFGPYGADLFANQGTIAVSGGDTFDASGIATLTNTGVISASGSSTVLDLGGIWSNAGSIAITSGATANLGGTFTLATFSSLSNTGGQLNITGTLLNTGTTLTLGSGSAAGTVGLSGTIMGGTIVDAGGGLSTQSGSLVAVSYQGTLTISDNDQLYIGSGLNVASNAGTGTINDTGNNAYLYFRDSQTLDNATLNLGSASTSYLYIQRASAAATLTLGTHLNLVQAGANAVIYIDAQGAGSNALINQGMITAGVSGGNLQIYGPYTKDSFTNQGSIIVTNADTLDISSVLNFTNLKAGVLTGGFYEVDANSTLQLAQNVSITTDTATITLSGAASAIESLNTSTNKQITIDQKLTSISSTGVLNLLANRSFSASAAFTDSGMLRLGGGTFTDSAFTLASTGHVTGFGTLAAPLADSGIVEAAGGTLTLAGAITGTGALQIDAGATLDIKTGASTAETVTFNGQGGVLKLDAGAGFASVIAGYAAGDVINLGTLTATAESMTGTTLAITLAGGSVLNETLAAAPVNEHVGISADGHSLTAYRFAAASVHTPEPSFLATTMSAISQRSPSLFPTPTRPMAFRKNSTQASSAPAQASPPPAVSSASPPAPPTIPTSSPA